MYLLITAVVLAFCAGAGIAVIVLGLCRGAAEGDRARYEELALDSTVEHAPY